MAHARTIAERELDAAIDNPMILLDGRVESCGNFHGAPVGFVCDFLAIAASELCAIAERRTDRLLDKARSHGLPPFLAPAAGVNSGLMIAHYTQAAMAMEAKRLAVPASTGALTPLERLEGTVGCSRSSWCVPPPPSTCAHRCSPVLPRAPPSGCCAIE